MGEVGRRRRRTTRRVAITGVAVVAAGAAIVAANGIGLTDVFGNNSNNTSTSSDLPPATAPVTRETLVQQQTATGDLGYGATTAINGVLRGTLTELPRTGATIDRGKRLYRVDNSPVLLLIGKIPAYRDLENGTEGPDVKQLEQNLSALGYGGFTVDNDFTWYTAEAVMEWQEDNGLTETGKVELGRVVYALAAIRVDTLKAALGDSTGGGEAVLAYTGSSQVVTVELAFEDRAMAKKGAAVQVTLPDGKKVPGKVAGSTMVIKPAASSDEEDTTIVEVTVTANDPKVLKGLDQATLDVAFTAAQREGVLTVPVAALVALSEGGYGVQLVDGSTTRTVAVQTGLFANGRVEVTSADLKEGATVGIPA